MINCKLLNIKDEFIDKSLENLFIQKITQNPKILEECTSLFNINIFEKLESLKDMTLFEHFFDKINKEFFINKEYSILKQINKNNYKYIIEFFFDSRFNKKIINREESKLILEYIYKNFSCKEMYNKKYLSFFLLYIDIDIELFNKKIKELSNKDIEIFLLQYFEDIYYENIDLFDKEIFSVLSKINHKTNYFQLCNIDNLIIKMFSKDLDVFYFFIKNLIEFNYNFTDKFDHKLLSSKDKSILTLSKNKKVSEFFNIDSLRSIFIENSFLQNYTTINSLHVLLNIFLEKNLFNRKSFFIEESKKKRL